MNQVKEFSHSFPLTGQFLLHRYLKKHLGIEMELIKGKFQNQNTHPSIIHFSVNKAATQFIRSLLMRCAGENGMTMIGLAEYAFHTKFPYLDRLSASEMEKYQYLFKPTGYIYSVFGGMVEGILELEKYKVILVLRDPRDVLVSEYYSYGFSHSEPSHFGNKYNDFMKLRRKARSISIDEYVESESDRLYANYQRYCMLLLDRYPHVFVTKYEDMTLDFPAWLKEILDYTELNISNTLFTSLVDEAGRSKPKQENIHQHIRKGTPGDFKEKLEAKTIENLNSKFLQLLSRFGYVL